MFDSASVTSTTPWVGLALHDGQASLAQVEVPANGQRPRVSWVDHQGWGDGAAPWRALRRRHRLDRQRVVAVLPGAHYQIVSLETPDVPRADWADALRWRLKDVVDFPVDTAAIDVLAVPGPHADALARSVLVVVASADHVRPVAEQCEDARVRLEAIDIVETSLRNLCALRGDQSRGRALLWLAPNRSELVVTLRGELLLSRRIDVGSERLGAADEAVQTAAQEHLALEVQRTLDLCERLFSHANVADLAIVPNELSEPLSDYLREVVYLPVVVLPLAELLDLDAVPALADVAAQARYAVAIGAALRDIDGAG